MTKVTISVLGGLHFVGLDEAALTRKVKAVAAFLAHRYLKERQAELPAHGVR